MEEIRTLIYFILLLVELGTILEIFMQHGRISNFFFEEITLSFMWTTTRGRSRVDGGDQPRGDDSRV